MKNIRLISIYFIVACFYVCPSITLVYGDTFVSGNITTNTTWTKANSPYIVEETVQILSGVTLTIEEGVVVRFNRGTYLNIGGKIIARGSDNQRIQFTSNELILSPGDWGAIRFLNGSDDASIDESGNYLDGSIIEFSIIEYGGMHPNDATYRGGAISCIDSSPYISNNKIRDNNAGQNNGGGIYLRSSNAYIFQNEISNNVAGMGGGIYVSDSSPLLKKNTITSNSAIWGGGGIHINDSTAKVIENQIIENTAGNGSGGGICTISSGSIIVGNIIENNTAHYGGGIFSGSTPSPTIRQNRITMNTGSAGGGITVSVSFPNIKFNIIKGNTGFNFFICWGGTNSSLDIDVSQNYWGTNDTEIIESNIYDYYDDVELGKAIYIPYLTFSPPILINSIGLKTNSNYSEALTLPISVGSSLYIELVGVDGDPSNVDTTSVTVKSSITDTNGITVTLHETQLDSGIYRGVANVQDESDELTGTIGASSGETITISSDVEVSKTVSVSVINTYTKREIVDFDGDGKTDVAIWRPGDGVWYILGSKDGIIQTPWGIGSLNDIPVPGDYDGDGKTDLAVWRPGDGYWYIIKSSNQGVDWYQWGSGSLNDVPVPGDYDGDGKTDCAVWRPGDGVWYILGTKDGIVQTQWGADWLNDEPISQ